LKKTQRAFQIILFSFGELHRQPIESLVKSLSVSGARGLDVPATSADGGKAELLRQIRARHGVGQILFVGEDEEDGVPQFVLPEHFVQLVFGLVDSFPIVAVDDEDESLRVLKVVPPQGSDFVDHRRPKR